MGPNQANLSDTTRILHSAFNRAAELSAGESSYSNFPYSCDKTTVTFALGLVGEAREMIIRAHRLCGILPPTPVAELPECDAAGDALFRSILAGTSEEADARLALARRLAATACDMMNFAAAVLEGDRTIDGAEIHHGPLWDK